jgi:hypothetical protein
LLHAFEGANPRGGIALADVVVGAVDAGVAGAEDAVPGEVGDGVAGGVAVAEMEELDALGLRPSSANSLAPLVRRMRAQLAWAMTLAPCLAKTALPKAWSPWWWVSKT